VCKPPEGAVFKRRGAERSGKRFLSQHSTNGGISFLQDIGYTYNERGWLKTSTAALFALQLNYNDGTVPQYNGNISNQLWGTPGNLNNSYPAWREVLS